MIYEIDVEKAQPQPVLSIRVDTTPDEIGDTLGQLLPEVENYIQEQNIQPAGPPFSRSHSFGQDRVDLEAGLPVPEPVEGSGRITAGELPGGEHLVTQHIGPYDGVKEAYAALQAWMEEQGRKPAGPPWEIYLTDPGNVSNPQEWKTEIRWPIQ